MLESILNIAFLAQCLRISIPYALPALGGTLTERGGVVNIGLEGMLLIGAFATTVGVYYTGSVLVGIGCGIAAAMMTALLHSIITVTFRADQIVSGIGINLLAVGITKFSCQLLFNSSSNSARIAGLEQWTFLPQIPILGNPFLLFTLVLLVLAHLALFRTRFGLRLRAVGEHPEAADTLGIPVERMRHIGVVLSGACAGLGGAWLALDQHSFTDGMSAGRGFIALAAMIIGKWTPLGAVGASLLFGFAESASLVLQERSSLGQLVQMIPYLLTMIVLSGFIGGAAAPAADGVPYEKEGH